MDEPASLQRSLLAVMVDEFLAEQRAGLSPAIEAYAARLPGRESEFRELLELIAAFQPAALAKRAPHDDGARPESPAQLEPGASLGIAPEASDTAALLGRLADRQRADRRYQEQGEVARGGMGAILKVWDEDLRRHLAMKVIGRASPVREDGEAIDPRLLARFLEEAQITGQLDHPGVVPVHELGLDSRGRVYFTMRLVKGRDLKAIIEEVHAESGGWTQTKALSVIIKVCEAVAYAHSKGVIHRDLKPANVMVGRFGETYVMDWGLAKVVGREDRHDLRPKVEPGSTLSSVRTTRRDEAGESPESPLLTLDGSVIGTPAYMSPEQARGEVEKVDARSDVYAVGAMLYHLLTGEMPYVPRGVKLGGHAVWRFVLEGPPRPVHALAPKVPAELEAICEKAMSRESGARYGGLLEMAEDLQAYIDDRVVRAYETGALAELKKWVARNKLAALATAGEALALIAGITVSTTLYIRSERNATLAKDETARADAKAAEAERKHDELKRATGDLIRARELAQERTRAALWGSYVANLVAADAGFRANEVAEARRRLDSCEEGLRGWEWRYLHLATDTAIAVLRGHVLKVTSVAFSPDGSRIASGSLDRTVRLWNATGGECLLVLRGHDSGVTSLAFSTDGSRIASGSWDETVRVWDASSGESLLVLGGHDSVVNCLAFSPDCSGIAAGLGDETVRVWDATNGENLLVLGGHDSSANSVAFSPDGSRIISGSLDGKVRLWDVTSGENLLVLGDHDPVTSSVAFNPEGSRIVSGSFAGNVCVWDATSGENLLVLRGHDGKVNSVAVSPDGSRIASGSDDRRIRVWNATTGDNLLVLGGHDEEVNSVAFSPDGSRIASGSDDSSIRLWNPTGSEELLVLRGHERGVNSVAFSPDGFRIASGSDDGSIRLWNATSCENLLVVRGHQRGVCVAFSPDGLRIVSGSEDGSIRLWNTTTGEQLLVLQGHDDKVNSVAFSPDGSRIVSGSEDESVRLWDASSGESLRVLRGHERDVNSVDFSPDGSRLASGSSDRMIRVWNTNSGEAVLVLRGHERDVNSVDFSPDGSLLASGSEDRTVRVWKGSSGENLLVLRGHDSEVTFLAFSPDGSRIASGSRDRTVRVWKATSGESLLVLRGHSSEVTSLAFSPDGSRLASGSEDKTVRLWETSASAIHNASKQAVITARDLLPPLFERLIMEEDVVQQLQTDLSLPDDVRLVAIRLARLHDDDPLELNNASWAVVKESSGDVPRYERALRLAEAACSKRPENGSYLNTLGVAQYRVGQYEKAIATLLRSDELNRRTQPADAAFLAMAHHRMGNAAGAEAALTRFRNLVQDLQLGRDPAAKRFLEEAEALIECDPSSDSGDR